MKKHNVLSGLFAALGMSILILDSATALSGAQEGVSICLRTIIPSLFPFFILSGILVGSLMGTSLPLLRPLGWLLGMPKGTESLLISGFLGGYPVGARSVQDAWTAGAVSQQDAERMLMFCNNAGPAFLFGMAAPMFSGSGAGWVLWGIHIASALITGLLFREEPSEASAGISRSPMDLSSAMEHALRVTAGVCGWVIAFRMLCAFLQRWFLWLLPDWGQAAVTGLLELANGCMALRYISDESLRFLLCSGMLSLGGLCVTMQTMSVTQGLKLNHYLSGKLIQTVLSLLLSLVYLRKISFLWLLPVALPALSKIGKRGRISGLVSV